MKRALIGGALFTLIGALLFVLWMQGLLPSFEEIRASRDHLEAFAMTMPLRAGVIFVCVYIAAVALSVPIAIPLSLLGGFLFGSIIGTLLVTFAATAGATILFILSRYFFRDFFLSRAGKLSERVRSETTLNGFRDVLIARLVPAVPFSLINALAGLTHVRVRDYVAATALGIIPFTFVYVHAGVALGELTSLRELASSESAMFIARIALVIVALYLIRRAHSAQNT